MRSKGIYAHGTIQKYRQGCSCEECKDAKREHNKIYRDKAIEKRQILTEQAQAWCAGNVSSLPGSMPGAAPAKKPVPTEPGDMENAVRQETAKLSAAQERPATVANAIAMARILDNPGQIAQHPTASRQLNTLLNDLRSGSKRQGGKRLASVKAMTEKPHGNVAKAT